MEIANADEPVKEDTEGGYKGSPAEYGAGLKLAIERGWQWRHERGTYVNLTQSGADLLPRAARRFPCCDELLRNSGVLSLWNAAAKQISNWSLRPGLPGVESWPKNFPKASPR
jgi:hypothetical protein